MVVDKESVVNKSMEANMPPDMSNFLHNCKISLPITLDKSSVKDSEFQQKDGFSPESMDSNTFQNDKVKNKSPILNAKEESCLLKSNGEDVIAETGKIKFEDSSTPQNKPVSFTSHEVVLSVEQESTGYSAEEKLKDFISEKSVEIIELSLSNVKHNFNEFGQFMRIYIYVNDIDNSESTYNVDAMDIYFHANDEAFHQLHNPQNLPHPVYKLSFGFCHGIIPENCSHQVRKKSIEVNLNKATLIPWGTLGIFSRTSNGTSKIKPPSAVLNFSRNKWTPCTKAEKMADLAAVNNTRALIPYVPHDPFSIISDATRSKFYGYTGLENLTNTCFMNAVLQCLSNIDPLRDYFLSGQYQRDINVENPLGHGGEVARAYAQFLKQMWIGKQSSFSPLRLKVLTGEKITSMFMGHNQHDAQEFMSFFLDAIHEDLNKNKDKPKINYNDDDDSAEKELFNASDLANEEKRREIQIVMKQKADDMWKQYRLFNNSIIIDLFCGQFKSIISCPECSKKSIRFDPFLYIPLPIPPPKLRYEVIFFARCESTGMCKSSTRFQLVLPYNATAGELLNLISQKTNISSRSMRLIEQQDDHLSPKFLNHNWLLSDRSDTVSSKNRPMLLFEVCNEPGSEEYAELCIIQRSLTKLREPKNSINEYYNSRIGYPFIISVKKSLITFHLLSSLVCSYACHSVTVNRRAQCVENPQQSFTLRPFHSDDFYQNQLSGESSSDSLPHFVYYRTNSLSPRDVLAPFVLRQPNFNFNSEEEYEIIPPLKKGCEEENNISDESDNSDDSEASTIVNLSSDEQNEIQVNCLQAGEESLNASERTYAPKPKVPRILEYENDSLLDLGNCLFFLCLDWIDIPNGVPQVVVNLSENEKYISSDFSLMNDQTINLIDCLELFNAPEVLNSSNCWRCPSCKDLREATKQLSFWRLPPIIVIQLKRFKIQYAISRSKINQFISYPINGLDLSRFHNGENSTSCSGDNSEPRIPEAKSTMYDLFAVVNHSGGSNFGHYTAFARSFDGQLGWRHFDDTRVEDVSESDVLSNKAYLLFYKCTSRSSGK